MKLIVGLGNIGEEYDNTRHNVGFMALDSYLGNVKWSENKKALIYKNNNESENVIFIKPTTYMNLSGDAVSYYMNYYKIDVKDLLVIHDDMDLEIGTIRLKFDSSSGGHNGVKDIINHLGTKKFLRLKIGISKPKDNKIDYVLSKFGKNEKEILASEFLKTNEIIDEFISNKNIESIMNKYN